jgi:sporulation protein YabP
MEENKKITNNFQNIILENREKLKVSGVQDVLSFDDQMIIVQTTLGLLTIKGENLRVNKLNIDTSDFSVDGNISSLSYTNGTEIKGHSNFLNKIFK